MMADQKPFWWLLALVGVFVLVFAVGLIAKLSRRESEARESEAYRRDLEKAPDEE